MVNAEMSMRGSDWKGVESSDGLDPFLKHLNQDTVSYLRSGNSFNKLKLRVSMEHRHYVYTNTIVACPSQLQDYNKRALETIKSRHDPTVTTIAQGVLK
ncbi:hypothetical protein D9615_009025 [Tricholomella constricta]|uniref:Uncharacterized protein n=1 Tax=Tricholomella constricta TaxID=117010 RepID=A0A8H5H0J9_9AGAR|nr:hypothetical protein D9615_009025 [Tricholomella constricta]